MTAESAVREPAFPETIRAAVLESAAEFFVRFCGLRAVERPSVATDGPCAGIMGAVSFFGPPVWSFALVLPERTAVAVTRAFAGFDIPFDGADMGDAVGEIANIVAGDVSARLDARGVRAQMSLPTVVRGHDVELFSPAAAVVSRMGFASPDGDFWFKLVKARDGLPAAARPGT